MGQFESKSSIEDIMRLLIVFSIAIFAVQAIPVPSELLKYTSGSDDAENNGEPRKKTDHASRDKRSPVAPLVELTSELLAKHTSGFDDFDLDQAEADPRKRKDQASRDKRSPVAPLVELTSELLKYTSGSDDFDLDQAEADPRKRKDQASRDKRSPVGPVLAKYT